MLSPPCNLITTPVKSLTSSQRTKRRRFQRRNSQNAQIMMATCKQSVPALFKPKEPIGIEQAQRLFDTALQELIEAKDIDIKAIVSKTNKEHAVLATANQLQK
jgi:hypothetical protein